MPTVSSSTSACALKAKARLSDIACEWPLFKPFFSVVAGGLVKLQYSSINLLIAPSSSDGGLGQRPGMIGAICEACAKCVATGVRWVFVPGARRKRPINGGTSSLLLPELFDEDEAA